VRQASLQAGARSELEPEASDRVLAGDITVELTSGNLSLVVTIPEVWHLLQASLQSASSRLGIPPQNVRLRADRGSSNFHYQIQLPADFVKSAADIGQRMTEVADQTTKELNEAVRAGEFGNLTFEVVGTTVSWEMQNKMRQVAGAVSNSPAPARPLDVISAAAGLWQQWCLCLVGVMLVQL